MAIQLKTDTNRCSFMSLVFCFFFLSVYLDAAFENVGLSARPMGMGGSYTTHLYYYEKIDHVPLCASVSPPRTFPYSKAN